MADDTSSPTPHPTPNPASPGGDFTRECAFALELSLEIARVSLAGPDAEDLAQNVVLRLLELLNGGMATFPSDNELAAWVTIKTRGAALNWHKAADRRDRLDYNYMIAVETRMQRLRHPEHVARVREVFQCVADALRAMPVKRREAWLAVHDDGLSYREVAEQRGIAPETVHRHLGQAAADLRAALGKFEEFDWDDVDRWKIRSWYNVRPAGEPEAHTDD